MSLKDCKLVKMNIPNKLTLSRLLLAAILPFVILSGIELPYRNCIATVMFLLGAVTDVLDGYIARRTNNITVFGIFADPIADKLLVNSAMISLVYINRLSPFVAIALIGRDTIMTGFRLIASEQGVVIPALAFGKVKMLIVSVLITYLLLDLNMPILKIVFVGLSLFFSYLSLAWALVIYKEVLKKSADTQANVTLNAPKG